MTDNDSSGATRGQRTLAAILFTDVVGFSARMEADEDRTLPLVRRDLAYMTDVCEQAGGKVLKNTGDGLLMYFTSAVQAVQCALEIQRYFAQQADTLPAEDTLQHRVGIHLGDVFLDGSDVMGDGVNVAARIQGEAEPGGICVSQTVHDVVKNRISLQTTYLGPRELKNIREAVPVYRILLAAQDGLEVAAVTAGTTPRRRRVLWLAAAGVGCVLLAGGIWLALPGETEPNPAPTASPAPAPAPPPGTPPGTPPVAPKPPETVTVEFPAQPKTKADIERIYDELGKTPEGATATFIGAVLLWEKDPALAAECMARIISPANRDGSGRLSVRGRALLSRLNRQPHIARSYIVGTSPENQYRVPPPPYRISFVRRRLAGASDDRTQVLVVSSGADFPRPVELTRGTDGLWQVEKMTSLVMGIREPAKAPFTPPVRRPRPGPAPGKKSRN